MSHDPQTPSQQGSTADSLAAAIETLYRVFKRYSLKSPVDGCPHCVSEDDIAQLEAKPLRVLLPSDLVRYTSKAMTTWGSVEDFKHFLPRIFELVSSQSGYGIDIEIAIGKLAYGDWNSWPKAEQASVRQFLMCWWQHLLGSPLTDDLISTVDTCLCAIAQSEENLSEYLSYWRNDSSGDGALHLAEFIDRNHSRLLKKGDLENAFWDCRKPQMEQFIAWLCEPDTGKQLEAAFHQAGDEALRTSLSLAVQEWEWLKVRCV